MFGWTLRVGAGGPFARFNPFYMFSAGEQGVLYDPSDLTTLSQDAAGTTPVTAAGQPVGRMLDKSGRGNHATQSTAASRPLLQFNATTGAYYLAFDGIDDFLVTGNIDFTGTDKVAVFAGVRKLSDAAARAVAELSASPFANISTFGLNAPGSTANSYRWISRGTTSAVQVQPVKAAPTTDVLTGIGNISGNVTTLRINGTQAATSAANQGTGNYGNYPLYIGRRGGTTLPFNGHLYGLIITGRLTTDAETANTERLLATKTGVVLS